ncbi:MAG TPA: alpha-N-arabinofuranosidase, partial [Opitutaceae bacterium]|nr:alpha-N-arabinofuranosidase [Opitutaceae bacterium]
KPLVVSYDGGPVDVSAALSADGRTLTIGVVNPTAAEVSLAPALSGLATTGAAVRWHITGPSPEAHNTPGKPRVVDIQRSDADASSLKVPALSCAVFELPLK